MIYLLVKNFNLCHALSVNEFGFLIGKQPVGSIRCWRWRCRAITRYAFAHSKPSSSDCGSPRSRNRLATTGHFWGICASRTFSSNRSVRIFIWDSPVPRSSRWPSVEQLQVYILSLKQTLMMLRLDAILKKVTVCDCADYARVRITLWGWEHR
jgi:hypothetical protein